MPTRSPTPSIDPGTARFTYQATRKSLFAFNLPKRLSLTLDIIIIAVFSGFFLNSLKTDPNILWVVIVITKFGSILHHRTVIDPNVLVVELEKLSLQPSPKDTAPILFSDVRIYEESVSHIDIYHERISGLSKFRLLRHEFHAHDWDNLRPLLQSRVRHHSPEARIHTPLDPPTRKFF